MEDGVVVSVLAGARSEDRGLRPLTLRRLTATDAALVQALLASNPGDTERVTGAPPGSLRRRAPARRTAADRPARREDRARILRRRRTQRGASRRDDRRASPRRSRQSGARLPAPDTAFIGLLLVDGRRQGRGSGRAAYLRAEG